MDAPRIQYAKTKDGVSIAYWTAGSGPALVIPPVIFTSHLQMNWQNPDHLLAYELLTQRATVVTYDCRGLGLSQRDAPDFSFEAAVLDLEAVVEHLGLERFALYNDWRMGAVAFAYAASHPERVTHLVHWWRAFRASTMYLARQQDAIMPLMDEEWEMYTEVWARLILGWDSADASRMAAAFRAAHSPASFKLAWEAIRERSPEPFLQAIRVPTLVLYPLGDQQSEESVRMLASEIAGAHVVGVPMSLRSTGTTPPFPNEAGINAILDFINTEAALPGGSVPAPRIDAGAFRTILFTDLADHTAMMQRLGDAKGREVLREHERMTREVLAEHGGAEIKAMGDGFMASFGSAQKALECAIALQRAFEARMSDDAGVGGQRAAPLQGQVEPIRLHIGVNAGEPIAEEDDLFGSSVILAARAASKARGGQILVTNVVRELVAGKGFAFADAGEFEMKGFEEPVQLYEVKWRA